MIDITAMIRKILRDNPIDRGLCHIYVPHTTAAVTINENADPDVPLDIINALNRIVPHRGSYHHSEGNADAHIKALLTGCSSTVPIEQGHLALGVWQAVFFCEYDGPRTRKVFVSFIVSK